MADICIIYAHSNKKFVRQLYKNLTKIHSVWWDEDIVPGNFRGEIERQLSQAKCVIPVWCQASRQEGSIVIDEAEFAKRRNIPLLPIRTENIELPLGFGSLHTIDLLKWTGNSEHPGFQELLRKLSAALGAGSRPLRRPVSLSGSQSSVSLPVFFRSVSSHETQLKPADAVKALKLLRTDAILVSAYDMVRDPANKRIARDLAACRAAGAVVLLDSGNYEAYRTSDKTWKPKELRTAIERTPHDLVFCFDNLRPSKKASELARDVLLSVERDSKGASTPVLPILHAPRDTSGEPRLDILQRALVEVARNLKPPLIGVPERELGSGILARSRAVHLIRTYMNEKLGFYQPLHLLGTGNPISVAVFSACGADSFDGLEWCRTVADAETARLYHHQQYDFFRYQSAMSDSPVVSAAAADDSKASFLAKLALHNLDFFSEWMKSVQAHTAAGTMDRFLIDKLPKGGFDDLEKTIPEVFK